MKNEVGIWIDHREAVIARVAGVDASTSIQHIESGLPGRNRFGGGAASATEEDIRDRKFENQLDAYYDVVIQALQDADSLLILGPGEAKRELKERLEGQRRGGVIVAVETADKMTHNQVLAHTRTFFQRPRRLDQSREA